MARTTTPIEEGMPVMVYGEPAAIDTCDVDGDTTNVRIRYDGDTMTHIVPRTHVRPIDDGLNIEYGRVGTRRRGDLIAHAGFVAIVRRVGTPVRPDVAVPLVIRDAVCDDDGIGRVVNGLIAGGIVPGHTRYIEFRTPGDIVLARVTWGV